MISKHLSAKGLHYVKNPHIFTFNSLPGTRYGGDTEQHVFLIPADPDFKLDIEYHSGTSYSKQSGTTASSTIVTAIDQGDYMAYDSVDFGGTSNTKGILVSHSKGDDDGTIEVRLGDETGTVIAEFTPAKVGNWDQYQTAHIGIDDVVGVHAITFVAKEG